MKQAIDQHKRVLSFLKAVRGAFPDATIVFTFGACYGLYQILREVFPDAKAHMTESQGHIVTKIGGRFYDIKDEYIDLDGNVPKKLTCLTEKQMEYWDTVASSQRLEYMLKKYKGQ